MLGARRRRGSSVKAGMAAAFAAAQHTPDPERSISKVKNASLSSHQAAFAKSRWRGKTGSLLKYEHARRRWQIRFAEADGRYLKPYSDQTRSELRTIVDLVGTTVVDDEGPKATVRRFELHQQAKGKPLRLEALSDEEGQLWKAALQHLQSEARMQTTRTEQVHNHAMLMSNTLPLWTLMSEPFLSKSEACNLYVGMLTVTVLEGTNLQPADPFGSSDPYVVTTLTGYYQYYGDTRARLAQEWCKELQRSHTTNYVWRSLHPVWNDHFHLPVQRPDALVRFEVYDHDKLKADDPLGWCSCRLSELMDRQTQELILPLQQGQVNIAEAITNPHRGGESAGTGETCGTLRVRLQYDYDPRAHVVAGFYRYFPAPAEERGKQQAKFSVDQLCSHLIQLSQLLQPIQPAVGRVYSLLAWESVPLSLTAFMLAWHAVARPRLGILLLHLLLLVQLGMNFVKRDVHSMAKLNQIQAAKSPLGSSGQGSVKGKGKGNRKSSGGVDSTDNDVGDAGGANEPDTGKGAGGLTNDGARTAGAGGSGGGGGGGADLDTSMRSLNGSGAGVGADDDAAAGGSAAGGGPGHRSESEKAKHSQVRHGFVINLIGKALNNLSSDYPRQLQHWLSELGQQLELLHDVVTWQEGLISLSVMLMLLILTSAACFAAFSLTFCLRFYVLLLFSVYTGPFDVLVRIFTGIGAAIAFEEQQQELERAQARRRGMQARKNWRWSAAMASASSRKPAQKPGFRLEAGGDKSVVVEVPLSRRMDREDEDDEEYQGHARSEERQEVTSPSPSKRQKDWWHRQELKRKQLKTPPSGGGGRGDVGRHVRVRKHNHNVRMLPLVHLKLAILDPFVTKFKPSNLSPLFT
eukprot:g1761.t1